MQDEQRKEPPPERAPAAKIGEWLRKAREAQGMSLAEAAARLNMERHAVEAMEQGELEVFGAPVFIKGYLRQYATLVGLDAAALLAALGPLAESACARASEARNAVSFQHRPRRAWPSAAVVAVVVVASTVAVLQTWERPEAPVSVTERNGLLFQEQGPASAPGPVAARAVAAEEQILRPVVPAVRRDGVGAFAGAAAHERRWQAQALSSSPGAQPLPAARVTAVDVLEDLLQPAGQELRLRLAFSEECWTEVTDATGRSLYRGLGEPGETADLTGRAPFQVLLGNAGAARLEVDGRAFALPAGMGNGTVARFEIGSPDLGR